MVFERIGYRQIREEYLLHEIGHASGFLSRYKLDVRNTLKITDGQTVRNRQKGLKKVGEA